MNWVYKESNAVSYDFILLLGIGIPGSYSSTSRHLGNIMLHQNYWCELSEVHWMGLLKYTGCRVNCYSSTQAGGLQSSRARKVIMGNPSLDALLDKISFILIIFTLNGVHYSCNYESFLIYNLLAVKKYRA